jgi:hypothetical protein
VFTNSIIIPQNHHSNACQGCVCLPYLWRRSIQVILHSLRGSSWVQKAELPTKETTGCVGVAENNTKKFNI